MNKVNLHTNIHVIFMLYLVILINYKPKDFLKKIGIPGLLPPGRFLGSPKTRGFTGGLE